MTTCLNCLAKYKPGNWKWSAWQCSKCTKAGITPESYRKP